MTTHLRASPDNDRDTTCENWPSPGDCVTLDLEAVTCDACLACVVDLLLRSPYETAGYRASAWTRESGHHWHMQGDGALTSSHLLIRTRAEGWTFFCPLSLRYPGNMPDIDYPPLPELEAVRLAEDFINANL